MLIQKIYLLVRKTRIHHVFHIFQKDFISLEGNWYYLHWEFLLSITDIDHTCVEKKYCEILNYWIEDANPPHCWCHFTQTLNAVGLCEVAVEAYKHLEVSKLTKETFKGAITSVVSPRPNLYQLIMHLKDKPDEHFNYFIICPQPKESAIQLI